uniref:Acyl-CoA transferase/carnitine dehydratase-like protein n=1 Tax=uncultured bacterium UPO43 TaxID=1776968 RepID=A0A126SY10_9BACT|nr:acyl-CoA transferase/carnitine dehydratase-like protein [uncultured bacterium UPO43]
MSAGLSQGILAGMRVVEGSAFVAAPLGGMTLAQLGAEVIRFDPIGGGLDYRRWPVTAHGQSLFWAGLNKGKRSIAVDLRHPQGRELLTALITAPGQDAGIFLTNFPAQGWLSYEALARRRADLIMLNVLGSRDGGSAVDYTVNPRVGFPRVTGPPDAHGPVNHVLPAWDLITGQMAATGILAAERHRRRTGQGQLIRLALLDVALAVAGHLGYIAEVQVNGAQRERTGNDLYGAFGRDFETADGRRLMLVGLTPRQWQAIGEATGLTESLAAAGHAAGLDFAREGDRYRGREAIAAQIGPWIAARPYAEVTAAFDATGVCWGPYQSFRELVETDPECSVSNPLFSELHQPGIGRYRMPGIPLDFCAMPRMPAAPAPQLGADTEYVLADILGLPGGEIARLVDGGVVAVPGAAPG